MNLLIQKCPEKYFLRVYQRTNVARTLLSVLSSFATWYDKWSCEIKDMLLPSFFLCKMMLSVRCGSFGLEKFSLQSFMNHAVYLKRPITKIRSDYFLHVLCTSL